MAAKGGSWKSGKFTPASGGGGAATAEESPAPASFQEQLQKRGISIDASDKDVANSKEFEAAAVKLPQGTEVLIESNQSTYMYSVDSRTVEFTSVRESYSTAPPLTRLMGRRVASTQNISFEVDGSFGRQTFDPRSGTQIAIGVRRAMQAELAARPVGTIFSTSPFLRDGLGSQRQALYERVGFGKPVGSTNIMYGRSVQRNGRIVLEPINE